MLRRIDDCNGGSLSHFLKIAMVFFVAQLTPIESEFATSEDAAAYNAWFRAKVERAMASTEPGIPHDIVMAEMQAIIDRAEHR